MDESFSDRVIKKASGIMRGTSERLKSYAPKSELTRATYNRLDEGKLISLAEKYGEDKVKDWLERMKRT